MGLSGDQFRVMPHQTSAFPIALQSQIVEVERAVADSFYKSRKGPMVINGTVSSFTEQIIIRIGAINEGQ